MTLSAGQTLRISVANSLPPSAQVGEGRKFKMLFAATVFETNGRLIAHSDEITLAPGEFHSFDFNRADLPPSAERGIGALQLRCEIRRHTFPGFGGGSPSPARTSTSSKSLITSPARPRRQLR